MRQTDSLYAGSGITVDNAPRILKIADGAIVGTSLKSDGDIRASIDVERVRGLVETVGTTL